MSFQDTCPSCPWRLSSSAGKLRNIPRIWSAFWPFFPRFSRMFRRIFLAVSVVLTATPGLAGGSMAPEVRIIRVNPPASIRRMDEWNARKKEIARQDRAAEKSAEKSQRAAERRALEADKAYYKRLEADRKSRDKKKKQSENFHTNIYRPDVSRLQQPSGRTFRANEKI